MKAIWMAVAVALSLSTVACGGGEGACKKACKKGEDCKEGDPGYTADLGDCEKACEEGAKDADEADCKSEFNKAAKCGKKNFECDGSGYEECKSEVEDLIKCSAEDAE